MTTFAVIVTYGNRYHLVKQVIDSALAEGVAKVIVVDNNSVPQSREQLKAYEKELGSDKIKVLYLDDNYGSAGGFKRGLEEAYNHKECEYILVLDDDNVPNENALLKLQLAYEYLGEDKNNVLISFRESNMDNMLALFKGKPIGYKTNSFLNFHIKNWVLDKINNSSNKNNNSNNSNFPILKNQVAPYGGLFLAKDVIAKIGFPNEAFFVYADDHEWTLRMTNSGFNLYLCSESKLKDIDWTWTTTAYNIKNHLNIINPFKLRVKKFLSKSVDLYTIETKKVFEIIREIEFFRNKLLLIPNGFYMSSPYQFPISKEKISITVGRIGTPQKNNELLLSAISKVQNLGEYKFYFIGNVVVSFQKKVVSLFEKRNDLREKIILTGYISEKDKLFEFYKRAEVFCLTSIYEGFALVLTEALYHGCYLLSTDVGAAFDLTDNGKFASIVNVNKNLFDELHNNGVYDIVNYINDHFELLQSSDWFENASKLLADNIQAIINKDVDVDTNSKIVSENVYQNFNWNSIIENLLCLLENSAGKQK